ncbi:MAG: acetylglutamate kinase [Acidobacteria bacterium]|nr:acetylglutamate kinase [Acidobacteriota bacterium]
MARLLIKLGGTLLDTPESRERLTAEIAAASRRHQVTVVHGGGKQMTRFLAERNVESRFVGGLRVTTPEVLDAVLKVFAGSVNSELVAAFVRAGALPVGLTGADACLVEAEQLSPDLGAVGRPLRANAGVLHHLIAGGYLPVVACVGSDRQGNFYNVNGDQMAVACAIGFQADRLLFLTDVDGVRGSSGANEPSLTVALCQQLIDQGVATGGMQAKLTAASDALRGGAGMVVIAPGARPGIVASLLADEPVGTRILP